MTSPYSLVIFDCDGVLVSTGPVEPEVRDLLLREQGIITDKAALTRDLYGMTNEQIWAFLEANYGIEITPAFAQRYIRECHAAFRPRPPRSMARRRSLRSSAARVSRSASRRTGRMSRCR